MRVFGLVIAAFLVLNAQGVAAQQQGVSGNYVLDGFQLPAGDLVVLVPSRDAGESFPAGEAMARQQLEQQLAAAGYRVVGVDPGEHEKIWNQEAAAAGGIYDTTTGALKRGVYQQVLGAVARHIAVQTHCALVVDYRLVLRPAPLSGWGAEWDGQKRRPTVINSVSREIRLSGTTRGLSVELTGVLSDGRIAFRTFGGTSLPYTMNRLASKQEVRHDLFATDRETADGVKIALAPLLKP